MSVRSYRLWKYKSPLKIWLSTFIYCLTFYVCNPLSSPSWPRTLPGLADYPPNGMRSSVARMGGGIEIPDLDHCDGLVQERCNSSALAMELGLSCANPLIDNIASGAWIIVCMLVASTINSCVILMNCHEILIHIMGCECVSKSSFNLPSARPVWPPHPNFPNFSCFQEFLIKFHWNVLFSV